MSKVGGAGKSGYEKLFQEALAKARAAVNASGLSATFAGVLNAMEPPASTKEVVGGGSEKRPDYGKKPVHSVWFGPPPTNACDTLAASFYDKVWCGVEAPVNDPDVVVHFWCLPEWEAHYRDYFESIGSEVKVHALDELVQDFPEIEAVNRLVEGLPAGDDSELKDSWVKSRVGEAVSAFKTAVRERHQLFNPEFLKTLSGDQQRQYLQTSVALMRDHLLDPRRRSVRDVVSLKDLFVNLLLVMIGGFYFDSTVIMADFDFEDEPDPMYTCEEDYRLPEPTSFLPILSYDLQSTFYSLEPDIFCLGLPLAVPPGSSVVPEDGSIRDRMVNNLWGQVQRFFSPTGELIGKYPRIEGSGKRLYSKEDHGVFICSSESILMDLTFKKEIDKEKRAALGKVKAGDSLVKSLVKDCFGGGDKVICGEVQGSGARSFFMIKKLSLMKVFMQTHVGNSELGRSENPKVVDQLGESCEPFILQRKGYLSSHRVGVFTPVTVIEIMSKDAQKNCITEAVTLGIQADDTGVIQFALDQGVSYGRFLDLAKEDAITEEQWAFLTEKIDGFDKRKQAIDFIREIEGQLENPKQPTIFDSKQMLAAKSKVRDELQQLLHGVLRSADGDLEGRVKEIPRYIKSQREGKSHWNRVVWSGPGRSSSLGGVLAKIEEAFGGDQPDESMNPSQ